MKSYMLLILLLLLPIVSAKYIDPELPTAIAGEGDANIIVIMKDRPQASTAGIRADARALPIINGYAMKANGRTIDKLMRNPDVESIHIDRVSRILDSDIQLSVSTQTVGANTAWSAYNLTGRGVVVAVIDTGIDYRHRDLGWTTFEMNLTEEFDNSTGFVMVNTTMLDGSLRPEENASFGNATSYDMFTNHSIVWLHALWNGTGNASFEFSPNNGSTWYSLANNSSMSITYNSTNNVLVYRFSMGNATVDRLALEYNVSGNPRYLGGYDFINSDDDPADDHGHGTHCMGIIGANGSVRGVAPETMFYALKGCDSGGSCPNSYIINAIGWAVGHGADVISMSLGGTVIPNDGRSPLSLAVQNVADNVTIVIAAGNSGAGSATINSPGDAPGALTVGSSNDQGTPETSDDALSGFSSLGPAAFGRLKPEVLAPGSSIYSTLPGNNYGSMSGTSMATPHVAGAAAILLEYDPSYTPDQITQKLMQSAYIMDDNIFKQGTGIINITNAIETRIAANISGGDRWELSLPRFQNTTTEIIVWNHNNYSVIVNFTAEDLNDSEEAYGIDASALIVPGDFELAANSSAARNISFVMPNASVATYGSLLRINTNDSRQIVVPVVVTVPLEYRESIRRSTDNGDDEDGDFFYFMVRHLNDTWLQTTIDWIGSSTDLDLYVYDSNGTSLGTSGVAASEREQVNASVTEDVTWFLSHSFSLASSPLSYNISVFANDAPELEVEPNVTNIAINENNTLRINVSSATDADGDNISYYWYVDSMLNSSAQNLSVSFGFSSAGIYNITLVATDYYGLAYEDYWNLTVVNVNRLPAAQNVSVLPAAAFLDDNLSCSYLFLDEDSDPDNSSLTRWYINGAMNLSFENSSISAYSLSVGDVVSCEVVPKDFQDYGPAMNSTNVTMLTSAPVFNITISDVTWYKNNAREDELDLDEHFYDIDTPNLSYSFVGNSSIRIVIDENNSVSYYPTTDWTGTEHIVFYANDSADIASSNNVTLTVVEPPPPGDDDDSGGGSSRRGGSSILYTATVPSSVIRKTFSKIDANTLALMMVANDIPVKYVSFISGSDLEDVVLEIVPLKQDPVIDGVRVYYAFNITLSSGEPLLEAVVNFVVNNTWINGDKVVLIRITDESVQHEAIAVDSDEMHTSFQANVPGFSTFVIGAVEPEPAVEEIPEEPEAIEWVPPSATVEVSENPIPKRRALPWWHIPAWIQQWTLSLLIMIVAFFVLHDAMRHRHLWEHEFRTLERFIHKAMKRGFRWKHVRHALVKKGWPKHVVDHVYHKRVKKKN